MAPESSLIFSFVVIYIGIITIIITEHSNSFYFFLFLSPLIFSISWLGFYSECKKAKKFLSDLLEAKEVNEDATT